MSYQARCAVRITGQLRIDDLKAAVQSVIARHEILRTSFQCLPGMTIPMQVINEAGGFLWQEADLSGRDEPAALAEAQFRTAAPPFDFEQGPLLDLHLIRLAKDEFTLILRLPAICADAVSLRNLVGELSLSYAAAAGGEVLDPEVIQYADLAEWQNELIEAEETRAGREYWYNRTLLRPATPLLAFERTGADELAFAPTLERLELTPSLTAELESFARIAEVTLDQVLLACWGVLLWRHTEQSEIEIGTLFDGRRAAEVSDSLGLLARYLPISCRMDGDLPLIDLIGQVAEAFPIIWARQEYFSWERPGEQQSSTSNTPFFPFCFDPETEPANFSAGQLALEIFEQDACLDRFKIKLSGARRAGRLAIDLHYNSELFCSRDIGCLSGHLRSLLESVVSTPAAKLAQLEMITEAERRQLLFEYNSTRTEWPSESLIHELFSEQATRTPEAIAVIYQEERLTYHELNVRAARLAHYLRRQGVGPEVIVGLAMERSPDLVVGLLAILKAGGAYLPLDPASPPARLAYLLEDAAVAVLLTQTSLRPQLSIPKQIPIVCVDAAWETIDQAPVDEPVTALSPENLAYVIYTSGSTGRPKGVMLRHRSLKNYLLWALGHYPLAVGCGAPVHSPLSFDLTITSLFTPLLAGGYVHLLSTDNETEALGAALSERPEYSLVKLTPAHLQLLAAQLESVNLDGAAHSLVIGGENLPQQTVGWWRERAATTRLFNEYGPTESVVGCCVYEVGADPEAESGRASIPIGRPIANTSLFILDGRQQPLPELAVGELCISGEGLARGYLNHPDLTAERFVPHPYSERNGERLYRTGDLARYLRGGQIECLGRIDEQVKIRGYRIELGEIEAALRDILQVREAVVTAIRSEDGQNRLIGYIAGDESEKTDLAGVRRRLQEYLPEYMIPATIIALEALPLTPNGKIDRKRLPSPEDAGQPQLQKEIEARTPVEEILAGIFQEVLRTDRVGVRENFFALGGHSLLATQVASRIRKTFGVKIGVNNIFKDATVEGLAGRIERAMSSGEREETPSPVKVPRGGRLPLSFAQQRLWFIEQLKPGAAVYNTSGAIRLEGRLDLESLESVINEIVRRHEVLRTRIEVDEGEPVQMIDDWSPRRLEIEDLTGLPSSERESEVRRLAREEAGAPFDLQRGPLLRVKVLKLAEDDYVMLHTMHHIVSDGWSMGVLVREVCALYEATVQGQPSPLPELEIQYADYARWQREYLSGEALSAEVEYWRERLAGAATLELPADHPRPAVPSYRGGRVRVELGREVREGLKRLSQREGATLFMVLMAAFKVVLMRYSGEEDLSVGTAIANRTRGEVEGLIGFFVNTLVMRTDLSGNPSFRELIGKERDVALGAYGHQEVPFEKLVGEINPERDLSRSPLFQVMMALQNARREELEIRGVKVSGIGEETEATKFDLTLMLMEGPEEIRGYLEYSRDLYEAATIRRLARHFEKVLGEVVRDAEQRIWEIVLLSVEEKRAVIEEWNETALEHGETRLVHEIIAELATRSGDSIAVKTDQESLSYGALNRRADQLASYLSRSGVASEDRIGICTGRSAQMIVGILGILKAGAAYVPIDGNYPEERVRYMLQDAGVKMLLTQGEAGERLENRDLGTEVIDLERSWETIVREWQARPSQADLKVAGENLAYVIYTSGSTGQPKGVAVSHRNLINLVCWHQREFKVSADDRATQLAGVGFDASIWEVWPYLTAGAGLHLVGETARGDLQELIRWMAAEGITISFLPTPLAELALRETWPEAAPLRLMLTGGDQLRVGAPDGVPFRVVNNYGPTECTVVATFVRLAEHDEGLPPIGRAISNTRVYLLDRRLEPVPAGVRGELGISGAGVARGYWRRPELTAERFVPDQFSRQGGERLYRTGDVGRHRPDGNIEFIGRTDEQVKIRGYRIELTEIEAVLNEHPLVKQSVVIVAEDGAGRKRLVGYVLGRERVTAAELKRYVRERLPEYMVPGVICLLDLMPVTANGKIDRKSLPAVSRPEEAGGESESRPVRARTPVEEILVGIFQQVLKLDRVGIHDNFFELGGDSILSIQIISRANEAGLGLTPKQLFQHQSIAELAAVAGSHRLIESAQEHVEGEVPLTPIQEWFFDGKIRKPEHFNLSVMLEAAEELDLEALSAVIRHLIKQHDVLRHRFHQTPAGWRQSCEEAGGTVELEVAEIAESDEKRASEAIEAAAEEYQRGLNLDQGPLMRVVVFRGSGRRQRVLLVVHHLIVDGVSWRILLGDLERGYEQARRGEEIELGAKTTSYKRWAERLKEEARSERSKEEARYWLAQEGTVVKGLPVDLTGANTAVSGQKVAVSLSQDETTGLLQEVTRAYKTQIHEVLLSAVARAVSEWSAERTVPVDLEGHGREEIIKNVDLTRTVGWFTTLYPVQVEVRGRNSVELLRHVKEQIREAGRRSIYYGMLRYLSEDPELRRRLHNLSRAEISFNYLGRLDLILKRDSLFRGATESVGQNQSLEEERRYLIEITGGISGGRLHLVWTYSGNLHRRETIEAVAERAMEVLREVVAGSRSADGQPLAPSDFPLARLDQQWLDRLGRAGREIEEIYPLSPLQKAMLFHTLSGSNPHALFVQWTCNLRGKVDLAAFKRAWQSLIERHAILSTAFEWEQLEDPVQVVYRRVELPIEHLDWAAATPEEQAQRFEVLVQADRWRGFDISHPPLMRLSLIRLGEDRYRLVWSHHHLLLDGWSSSLLLHEVLACYEASRQGHKLTMEKRPQYREYIAWLNRQDSRRAEEYWRERLKGFNQPIRLWIDRGAGGLAGRQEAYEDRQVKVGQESTARLQEFARRYRLTINTILQGAWSLLLSKYSGEEDIVFGTTVSGRPADLPGSETIVGPFINTLPVRVRIPLQTSVSSWLSGIQSDQIEFSQYAYRSLVEQYSEIPLGMPLYESILIFENYPVERLSEEAELGLEVSDVRAPVRTKYPLTMVSGTGSRLPLSIAYDLRRFEVADIDRLLRHFQNLIEEIADHPERPVWSLSPLSRTEREQLLDGRRLDRRIHQGDWQGDWQNDWQNDWFVHHQFETQVEKSLDAIAVVYGEDHLSYDELNRRANRLARHLQKFGVGPEVGVGIYIEPSPTLLIGWLGTIKAGGACLSVEPAERADLPASQVIPSDFGAHILLTQQSLIEPDIELELEIIRLDSDWDTIDSAAETNPDIRVQGANLACTIYTSGSTGEPKQVMITHCGWRNYLFGIQNLAGLAAGDRVLQQGRPSMDTSTLEMFGALLAGARLVMARPESCARQDWRSALIAEEQITTVSLTPSIFSRLLREAGAASCTTLRRVTLSGETLYRGLETQSSTGLNADLCNAYSVAEASGAVAAKLSRSQPARPQAENGITPIGDPLANTRVYLLDSHLEPVPTGVAGEVWVAGEGVARGYFEQPDSTAENFLPDPFREDFGERMFRTKDVARRLADGEIEILTRSEYRARIKFGRLEPALIESALMAYQGIDQAVLLLVEEAFGGAHAAAYLACDSDRAPTAEQVRAFLRERFPAQMIPAAFPVMRRLPLTINGRIDRKALASRGPGATPNADEDEAALPAESTPYEEILRSIWADLFSVDELSGDENFFEMGGHSLLATQIVSRLREVFKVELPLRAIFESPTIKGMARQVEEAIRTGEQKRALPLVRAARDGRWPLSFAQQRLWFLDQLVPDNPFYNCSDAVRLEGSLDLKALEATVNEIIRRHEVLRTRIEVDEGEPVQVIDDWGPRKLEVEDLTGLPQAERETAFRRLAREEAGNSFDLAQGPLLRVKVLKLAEDDHVVLYSMHHIVSDGWSMGVLVREVCALYEAMVQGQPSPLPELGIQYADYARWQREYLSGEVLSGEVEYWRERLAGAATLELPADHPRPAASSYRGGRERVELGREVREGLRRLSQREGATLFMVLMAAFKVVLMRYSREEDLSVGTVIANRTRREVEGLIGFFVNTLVMRTDLSGNPSFRELIGRERDVALGAYGHQEVPFEKLVEEINPERDLSRSPLFQVMMLLQNARREELEVRGVKVSGIGEEAEAAKFDLTLMLVEGREGIGGHLEYSRDLYEAETIRRMARHYERVIEEALKDAEQRIREVELMSLPEKEQVIVEFNRTQRAYPITHCIHELIELQAEGRRDGTAVIFEDESVTYGELNARANQLAFHLKRRGAGPEVLVGLCVERSVEMVVGVLGILKAGAAYVPLDPTYPPERLSFMLEDARVSVILTQERWRPWLPDRGAPIISLDRDWPEIGRECVENPKREVSLANPAYLIYTSGSTGRPKGAVIPHGAILNHMLWMQEVFPLDERDRVAQKTPFSFDASVWEFYAPLLVGGQLVVARPGGHQDSVYLTRLIVEREVTILQIVPSMLRVLIDEAEIGECRGLRRVFCGGEALTPDLRDRFFSRLSSELHNLYGPAEATIDATSWTCRPDEEPVKEIVPIGRPIANLEAYVLDRRWEPVPVGVKGELYLGGRGLGRGYLGRPELTAERFIPHRFSPEPGARLYRTGDRVRYLPNGNLEFLGRMDDQVKFRGFRIELGEIERVLELEPRVREAVVVLREREPGDQQLVAYVVGGTGREEELRGLKRYLKEKLPEYMVPSAIMALEKMPLNPSGKLDRRALPEPDQKESGAAYVPPQTPIEEILVGIFEEVLKLDRVGIRGNFFELGGHSLLATQAISRVRRAFGVEIGVRALFEEATAAGLAKKIEEAIRAGETAEAPPLVRVSREGNLPLSFAQQRLWFLDQLMPNNPFYNCPAAVRLEGSLNLKALEGAINEIIRRHEVLRTRIELEADQVVQVIESWQPRRLEIEDLTNLTPEEREAEVKRIAKAEAGTGFDLKRGPLLRMRVLKLEEEQHAVFFTMHHIVSDAWSVGILVREVGLLYQSLSEERESPLPELEIQYADYAYWQRNYLRDEVEERHLRYWTTQLGGKLPVVELTGDRPRPSIPSYQGASKSILLPAELSAPLRALSRREGVTMFMLLLAAFKTLLYRYTAMADLVVGIPTANRSRPEIEPLIGFFVNMLPMRTDLSGNPRFTQLLKRVKDVALGAYAHQEIPFEKLVEQVQPDRSLGQMPLFNIAFGIQNAPRAEAHLTGLKIRPLGTGQESARLELTLWVTEHPEALEAWWIYSTDRFEEETIIRLHHHFRTLLSSLVARPDAPLDELEIFSEAERSQQAADQINRKEDSYQRFKSVKPQAVSLSKE